MDQIAGKQQDLKKDVNESLARFAVRVRDGSASERVEPEMIEQAIDAARLYITGF